MFQFQIDNFLKYAYLINNHSIIINRYLIIILITCHFNFFYIILKFFLTTKYCYDYLY